MGWVWMMLTITAVTASLLVTQTAACMKKEEPRPEVPTDSVPTAKPVNVTLCTKDDAKYGLCTNGGNCTVEIYNEGKRRSYCQCPPQYTGSSCEERRRHSGPSAHKAPPPLATGYAVAGGVSVFLFIIVLVLVAVFIWIKKKRSGQSSPSSPRSNGTELHPVTHTQKGEQRPESAGLMSTESNAA